MVLLRVLAFATCLMLLPSASSALTIYSEAGTTNVIPVGTPVTFHAIHYAGDVPAFHKDTEIRVLLNDRIVFALPPTAGHEYDGVLSFTTTFGEPGPIKVQAIEDEMVVHQLEGEAVLHDLVPAVAEVRVAGSAPTTIGFDISMANSSPHTETYLSIQEGQQTQLRTELHDHAMGQEMQYSADATATLRATHALLQTGSGPGFAPILSTATLQPSPRALLPSADWSVPTPPEGRNEVVVIEGDGMDLVFTYDPFTAVPPGTLMRQAVIARGLDGQPLGHTDMSATLIGPFGAIWSSDSIHEHDGIWEFASRQDDIGQYRLHVRATNGDATVEGSAPYYVFHAGAGAGAKYTVSSLHDINPEAGELQPLEFSISDVAGRPFAHGEAELEIRDEDGTLVMLSKLHSHESGLCTAQFAFPAAGEYTIRLDPYALEGAPGTFVGDLQTQVTVRPNEAALLDAAPASTTTAPSLYLALGAPVFLLLGAGLATWLATRRPS